MADDSPTSTVAALGSDQGFKFGGWSMAHFNKEAREEIDRLFSNKFDLLLGPKTYEIFAASS